MKYLEIAKFVKTHGLKGELKAVSYASSLSDFGKYTRFYLGNEKFPLKVMRHAEYSGGVILKLDCSDSIESAYGLLRKILYVDRDEFPLPEGEYYIADLIGLEVADVDTGVVYGKVGDVMQYGTADVYSVITHDKKQILFPGIKDILKEVDLISGKILIKKMDGLFDV